MRAMRRDIVGLWIEFLDSSSLAAPQNDRGGMLLRMTGRWMDTRAKHGYDGVEDLASLLMRLAQTCHSGL